MLLQKFSLEIQLIFSFNAFSKKKLDTVCHIMNSYFTYR